MNEGRRDEKSEQFIRKININMFRFTSNLLKQPQFLFKLVLKNLILPG